MADKKQQTSPLSAHLFISSLKVFYFYFRIETEQPETSLTALSSTICRLYANKWQQVANKHFATITWLPSEPHHFFPLFCHPA